MRKLHVVEDLCNGCRLCETFCSSLADGVFGGEMGRIQITKVHGSDREIPILDCNGRCIRPIYGDGQPTCVALCPTGALIHEDEEEAVSKRLYHETCRKKHSLFKVIAPWKWPFPWRKPKCGKATSGEGDEV